MGELSISETNQSGNVLETPDSLRINPHRQREIGIIPIVSNENLPQPPIDEVTIAQNMTYEELQAARKRRIDEHMAKVASRKSPLEAKIKELEENSPERKYLEKLQEEKEKKAKEKRRITKSYIILGVIILITASFIFYWVSGYSHSKVEVAVVSKTNDKFNENLADGHYQAGYFYVFGFEVENNSQHDVKLIGGTMEIFNANGESLAVSNVELQGKLKGNSTEHWNMRLQVNKGDAARELWNSDLSELKITFRIKKIHFEDGTYKNYSNTKNEIIYPQN